MHHLITILFYLVLVIQNVSAENYAGLGGRAKKEQETEKKRQLKEVIKLVKPKPVDLLKKTLRFNWASSFFYAQKANVGSNLSSSLERDFEVKETHLPQRAGRSEFVWEPEN